MLDYSSSTAFMTVLTSNVLITFRFKYLTIHTNVKIVILLLVSVSRSEGSKRPYSATSSYILILSTLPG